VGRDGDGALRPRPIGVTLAVALAAVGLATLAPSPAGAEAFLDAFTGVNFTRDADVRVKQPAAGNDFTIHGLAFEARPGEKAPYYGIRVGAFFGEAPASWGLALEFFHFKAVGRVDDEHRITGSHGGAAIDVTAPARSIVQQFELSNGLSYVNLEVLGRYGFLVDPAGFPHGRLQLYAGLGGGPAITYAYSTIDGSRREGGYEVAGPAVQAFAGIRFLIWRHVGLFAEGKYTRSWLTVPVARGGHADVDEESLHLVGGLTVAWR
jgi:hypothetical protein